MVEASKNLSQCTLGMSNKILNFNPGLFNKFDTESLSNSAQQGSPTCK